MLLRSRSVRVSSDPKALMTLDAFLKDAPGLLWRSGRDERCDWFNEHWLTFTGHSLTAELAGGGIESVHPDDLRQLAQTRHSAFAHRTRSEADYQLRRHDG